jgi:pimeloyl-ACP methyl ester carboxylesterase
MIDKPRIGYATLSDKAHVHAPARYLPIIIVPGIAGSRLMDPVTGKLAWNPLGAPLGKSPGVFTADYDRLAQTTAELVPDELHTFDATSDEGKAAARIKHYYTCLHDVYGPIATSLSTLDLSAQGIKTKVYCAGYDWRIDNARAAMRLAEVVEEALAETRERRVIIVAHSMGCIVSRYYSRVLGGESKIHRIYMLGPPTLGAPGAYLNLKNGLPGLYVKDMIQDAQSGNKAAALGEGIQEASQVEGGILNAVNNPGQGMVDKATAITGDLFIALSLGAGRLLSREDTKWMARQMPALYQLIPTAIFCRDQKNWLIFDPAATGLPPTGYMIVLPTLFDLLADLAGGAFKSFFQPDEAQRTAPEATRNMQTLAQRLAAIGDALADKTDFTPAGQQTETGFSKVADDEKHAILMMVELLQRILAAFVDGRSNRQLYMDIYTGLLDEVPLRATCAANLALNFRLDDALTVNPSPETGESPLQWLATTVILPALAALPGPLGTLVSNKLAASQAAAAAQTPATAYMHPRAVCIYNSMMTTDAGGLLVPTDTLSNDDSNIVEWTLIPYALVLPLLMAIGGAAGFASSLGAMTLGDATVPTLSTNPDPSKLSNPFLATHQSGPHVRHLDLISDTDIYSWLSEDLTSIVPDFLTT